MGPVCPIRPIFPCLSIPAHYGRGGWYSVSYLMFEAVRDISLRTILLVAIVVWAMLAAIWFLSLGSGAKKGPDLAAASTTGQQPSAELPRTPPAAFPPAESQSASEDSTPGQDVIVSTAPKSEAEAPTGEGSLTRGFALQVGAFRSEESAKTLLEHIKTDGFAGFLQSPRTGDPLYRVMIGPFPDRAKAMARQESLKARGIESFVKELE